MHVRAQRATRKTGRDGFCCGLGLGEEEEISDRDRVRTHVCAVGYDFVGFWEERSRLELSSSGQVEFLVAFYLIGEL